MAHGVDQGAQDDDVLRLDVLDFVDLNHWRWRLTDPNGAFLADHEVKLAPGDPLREALLSLSRYLRRRADPDKWPDDEARLLDEVGRQIGERIFGPIGQAILDYGTPVTVRVLLPSEPEAAPGLLAYPLELAHIGDRPLALQDVSLVYEVTEQNPPTVRHRPTGETSRKDRWTRHRATVPL